jgi:hypothetical protein
VNFNQIYNGGLLSRIFCYGTWVQNEVVCVTDINCANGGALFGFYSPADKSPSKPEAEFILLQPNGPCLPILRVVAP